MAIAEHLLSVSWLLVLGGFIVVSWVATRVAASAKSRAAQYAGLGIYVVAESIIFVPLLYVADSFAPGTIRSAATLTLLAFIGLTVIVFRTGKDFAFLAGLLRWAVVLALIAIVGAVLFGVGLGMWFSLVMIGVAGAAILYDTSNIIRVYPSDRYVAGALQLFASVALMFWYVLSFFLAARRWRRSVRSRDRFVAPLPAGVAGRPLGAAPGELVLDVGQDDQLLELGERALVVVGERAELRRAALGELHLGEASSRRASRSSIDVRSSATRQATSSARATSPAARVVISW